MAKAICIIRTSTDRQEVEMQRKEVVSLAVSDGYKEDEIEVIGGSGASAIKLDDRYNENLAKVYRLIESGCIEVVYAWSIDRIGRDEEVLMRFKRTLIDSKIQLVVKIPSLRLLNDDGTVNTGMELAFSIFATMSKQEMEQKKERFKRGKNRNREQGRYNGGFVRYGYKVDAKGFIVVDEEKAKVVRLIYDLFCTRKYSTSTLAKELNSRGYKSEKRIFNTSNVTRLLKCQDYTGTYEKGGVTRTIPAIISKEQQERAMEILRSNNTTKSKSYRHSYFANKLIVCGNCGRHFEVTGSGVYQCTGHILSRSVGYEHLRQCGVTTSITADNLDGILWELCKRIMAVEVRATDSNREQEIKKEIAVVSQKIEACGKKLSRYQATLEKIVKEGDAGECSEVFTRERISNINKLKEEDEKELVRLAEKRRILESLIKNEDRIKKMLTSYNSITDIELNGDEKAMSDIVHRYVSKITMEKCEYKGSKSYKKIEVTVDVGVGGNKYPKGIYTFYFNGKCKSGDKCYFKSPSMTTEQPFKFEKIIRKDQFVTTEGIERFRKLYNALESVFPKMKDTQELADYMFKELCDLHKKVAEDNKQRLMQYLSEFVYRFKDREA